MEAKKWMPGLKPLVEMAKGLRGQAKLVLRPQVAMWLVVVQVWSDQLIVSPLQTYCTT